LELNETVLLGWQQKVITSLMRFFGRKNV
jgi:hypothetical protein